VEVVRWTSPAGRQRQLVTMEPWMADRYARVARIAVPRRPLGPRSYGSARRPETFPASGIGRERRAWRLAHQRAVSRGSAAEIGDVASCYPSIGERPILAVARATGGNPYPLLRLLRDVHDLGVEGLPIGPAPSSYLSDAVLALADLEAASAGVAPIRWVDDVTFVGTREAVRRSAAAWRSTLLELGLAAHDGKRRLLRDARVFADGFGTMSSAGGGPVHGIIPV
jgi:hypothetical protein